MIHGDARLPCSLRQAGWCCLDVEMQMARRGASSIVVMMFTDLV